MGSLRDPWESLKALSHNPTIVVFFVLTPMLDSRAQAKTTTGNRFKLHRSFLLFHGFRIPGTHRFHFISLGLLPVRKDFHAFFPSSPPTSLFTGTGMSSNRENRLSPKSDRAIKKIKKNEMTLPKVKRAIRKPPDGYDVNLLNAFKI